ncbi:MAG: long-chain fatty acid--CoA ligase [Smithellaceae bacterium]|nr:long-chain fatty acid--CoA ligase [Smithellaceae bacterium]
MNIGEWISKRAMIAPEKPFLTEKNKSYNNEQFNRRVNETARALENLGIVKGMRVALLMSNSSEFLEIFFACARTGMIMVPLNFRLAVPELLYILRDSKPEILIYSNEFESKIGEIKAAGIPGLRYYRLGEGKQAADPDFSDYVEAFEISEPLKSPGADLSDPLFIMYTSGTTGDPKGAVLTHQNILFGAIHSLLGYGVDRSYKSLVVAPLFHIGALAASVTPIIYAGGSIMISSFYNASEILKTICREKINYMFAVPVMYQMIADTPEWRDADLSHVHFFISGGAPIPLPVIRKYQDEKGVGFVQGYALTETGRLTSLDLEDSVRKAGSVGKEVFHVNLRIVDDQGRDIHTSDPGEILVQGPNVFSRYWNNEAATRAVFLDGWFCTGDMGRRDEDGFVYIVGRKVEMIISSGENIYPVEVERALQALPGVKEAAVVGIPDPKRGEVVGAFIIPNREAQMSESDVINALSGKIANFKVPKRLFFVDEFPRNQSGKVLKRILKKRAEGQ